MRVRYVFIIEGPSFEVPDVAEARAGFATMREAPGDYIEHLTWNTPAIIKTELEQDVGTPEFPSWCPL